MELALVNRREFVWHDENSDVEFHIINCDTLKEARKRLEEFIDEIRREDTFKDIKISN